MRIGYVIATAGLAGITIGAVSLSQIRAQTTANTVVQNQKRIELLTQDMKEAPDKTVMVSIDILPAGGVAPMHTHPGAVYHYVLEGEWKLEQPGQPTKTLTAGQGFYAERDAVHGGSFPQATKLLTFFVIDKGKPRALMMK